MERAVWKTQQIGAREVSRSLFTHAHVRAFLDVLIGQFLSRAENLRHLGLPSCSILCGTTSAFLGDELWNVIVPLILEGKKHDLCFRIKIN